MHILLKGVRLASPNREVDVNERGREVTGHCSVCSHFIYGFIGYFLRYWHKVIVGRRVFGWIHQS